MFNLKHKVSGTRRRFNEGDWDLDLTYICKNRIIVMSYPAKSSIQQMYRNDVVKVKKFFDTYHTNKYRVFNLSEQLYDKALFDGRVDHFPW